MRSLGRSIARAAATSSGQRVHSGCSSTTFPRSGRSCSRVSRGLVVVLGGHLDERRQRELAAPVDVAFRGPCGHALGQLRELVQLPGRVDELEGRGPQLASGLESRRSRLGLAVRLRRLGRAVCGSRIGRGEIAHEPEEGVIGGGEDPVRQRGVPLFGFQVLDRREERPGLAGEEGLADRGVTRSPFGLRAGGGAGLEGQGPPIHVGERLGPAPLQDDVADLDRGQLLVVIEAELAGIARRRRGARRPAGR